MKATLIRKMGRFSGLWLVSSWRDDAHLGPCMTVIGEVIAASAEDAIAHFCREAI